MFVDDLGDAGELRSAPVVEPPYPDGVNVEFVVRRGDRHVAMRVHERGVGETRSCGTGACAVMAASAQRDGIEGPSSYVVDVPGGRLTVTARADGHVELTGPAVLGRARPGGPVTTEPPVSTSAAVEALRSHGQQDAANRLLEQAAAALDDADLDEARALVQQAKALGRDEHEGVEVCSMTAHMALFTLVSEVAEDGEPLLWLEAAEAVLPRLSRTARAELVDSLLITGSESVELEAEEARLLGRLVHGADRLTSVFDGRVLDVDEVLEVLTVINAYEDAVDAIEGAS